MNKNRTLYEVVKGFESVNKGMDKLLGVLKDNMSTFTDKAREKVEYCSEVVSDNIRLQKLVAEISIKKGERSSLFEQLGEEVFECGFLDPSVKALNLMNSLFECDKIIAEKQAEYDALYKMCKEREEARQESNNDISSDSISSVDVVERSESESVDDSESGAVDGSESRAVDDSESGAVDGSESGAIDSSENETLNSSEMSELPERECEISENSKNIEN